MAVEPAAHALSDDLAADGVGLHHDVLVLLVDLEDLVHAAQFDQDLVLPFTSSENAPAGAEGLVADTVLVAAAHDGLDLFGGGGQDHGDGTLDVHLRSLVPQRLPGVSVQHRRLAGDELGADDGLQFLVVFFLDGRRNEVIRVAKFICHDYSPPLAPASIPVDIPADSMTISSMS